MGVRTRNKLNLVKGVVGEWKENKPTGDYKQDYLQLRIYLARIDAVLEDYEVRVV